MKRLLLVLMVSGLAGFGGYYLASRGHQATPAVPAAEAEVGAAPDAGRPSQPEAPRTLRGQAPAGVPAAAKTEPAKPEAPVTMTLAAQAETARPAAAPAARPAEAGPAASAVQPAPPPKADAAVAAARMAEAAEALKANDRVKAWGLLSQAYLAGGDKERQTLLPQLEKLSADLFWNTGSTDGATIHVVQPGDSLVRIGQKYGVQPMGVARINGILRPNLIRLGQKVRVFPGKAELLVVKKDYTLTLFIGGRFVKQYKVGLGKENKTPVGTFEIVNPLANPDWYPPGGGVYKFGDKRNLLGTRWLGFKDTPGVVGFGIHGTWEPETIGTMASNGCVRMRNDEVEELFDFVPRGSQVIIEP